MAYTGRRIRKEFPAVKPWEWIDHPDWHSRAVTTLNAESDGGESLRENIANGSVTRS